MYFLASRNAHDKYVHDLVEIEISLTTHVSIIFC